MATTDIEAAADQSEVVPDVWRRAVGMLVQQWRDRGCPEHHARDNAAVQVKWAIEWARTEKQFVQLIDHVMLARAQRQT